METINNFLELELIRIGEYNLQVYNLINVLGIYLITKLILFLIKKTIFSRKNSRLDVGASYALLQIIKYIVWVIAIVLILETLGVKLTVLIAGSAALLVGVGLGLQQTFNDILIWYHITL